MDLVHNLPADRVVLELDTASVVEESMLELLPELGGAGFMLALDQFCYSPDLEPALQFVDIVKLDMVALGARELAHNAFKLRSHGVQLVAQKIETFEDF